MMHLLNCPYSYTSLSLPLPAHLDLVFLRVPSVQLHTEIHNLATKPPGRKCCYQGVELPTLLAPPKPRVLIRDGSVHAPLSTHRLASLTLRLRGNRILIIIQLRNL